LNKVIILSFLVFHLMLNVPIGLAAKEEKFDFEATMACVAKVNKATVDKNWEFCINTSHECSINMDIFIGTCYGFWGEDLYVQDQFALSVEKFESSVKILEELKKTEFYAGLNKDKKDKAERKLHASYSGLSESYAAFNRFDDAISVGQKALASWPANSAVLDNNKKLLLYSLARSYKAKGDVAHTTKYLQELRQIGGEDLAASIENNTER